MKKNLFILFVLILRPLFSQNSTTNLCEALKPVKDFSKEEDVSFKKLNKMVGKFSESEILDYALFLDFDPFEKSEIKLSESQRIKLIKEFIYPRAKAGDLKALVHFFNFYSKNSKRYIWYPEDESNREEFRQIKKDIEKLWDYEDFVSRGINFPALKFAFFLENLKGSLLKSYFSDFESIDLIRLSKLIKDKITIVQNSKDMVSIELNDPKFCFPFNKNLQPYTALFYLKNARNAIDLVLVERKENPESLANILFDYVESRNQGLNTSISIPLDYMNPKDQYFINNKEWAPIIFKLLSGLIQVDEQNENINKKSYYLNRAAQLGATDSYFNLASMYQVLYYNTNDVKFNDSCVYYLDKLIPLNDVNALTLKGIKIFNGEGYIQNKEEGVKLILNAKSLGGSFASKLIDSLPRKLFSFSGIYEGFYFKQFIKINYPWDFKVLCSNGCGRYTYPKKIIFNRLYDDNYNLPQIIKAKFFQDNFGNPTIDISEKDFKKTFSISYMGDTWKHVMCSGTCQVAHENKNNKNFDEIKSNRNKIDNEQINCVSCNKLMKRADMLSISECPCYTESGSSINVSFTQSYDLFGDSEPKACSSECQINFCKTKCTSKGYTSKF
jgi:hypothetical protein